jgi:zinc protease
VKAPTAAWDDAFALLADVFLAPAMPSTEVAIAKEQRLSEIRHEMEDGDGRLDRLTHTTLYAGHPYEASIETLESVGGLADADVVAHAAKLRETSRLLLVVVGDVDATHVIDQVARAFASLPTGTYADTKTAPLHFDAGRLAGDAFKLPTNYVQTAFASPAWTDADYVPVWLSTRVLKERVWEEVRTKRNLSYAPDAYFENKSAGPYGAMYVTATDPETTMKVMMAEAKRLQDEPVPEKELAGVRAVFATRYAIETESTAGAASELAEAQILAGDWRFADKLLDRAKATTPAEIQAAAKKWMTAYQTAIVGEPKKLAPATVLAR